MRMILRLYMPVLRFKLAALSVLALLITFTMGLYAKITDNPDQTGGFYLISIMIILAPLTVARRDYRDISSQLPVTAGEKFAVLIFLYWLAFPLCISLAQWAGELCVNGLFGIKLEAAFYDNHVGETGMIYLCGLVQSFSIITVILYTLVKARKNRILSGIGAGVLTYASYTAISTVLSFGAGLAAGFKAAKAEAEVTEAAILDTITGFYPIILTIILATAVAVLAVFTFKLYKQLNNSGF